MFNLTEIVSNYKRYFQIEERFDIRCRHGSETDGASSPG